MLSILPACSFKASPEGLMKVPKFSQENQEIKSVIQKILPKTAKLTAPYNKEELSAIKFIDLDGDNEDEVVAFYKLSVDKDSLRALVLKKENGAWIPKGEMKESGKEFDEVMFKDITGNGRPEIIISSMGGEYKNKGVSMYSYSDDNIVEIFETAYEEMIIADLDNDELPEIVTLKKSDDRLSADLYKYTSEESTIEFINETIVDSPTTIKSIKVGKASKDKTGIFIQTSYEHYGATALLVMEHGQLVNAFYDDEIGLVEKTTSPYAMDPQDIDNDGIIEIPIRQYTAEKTEDVFERNSMVTHWNKWDGGRDLILVKRVYYNDDLKISFDFPSNWDKNITVRCYEESDENNHTSKLISFQYLNSYEYIKYNLLTIYEYNKADIDADKINKLKKNKYVKIGESAQKVYFATLGSTNHSTEFNEKLITIDEVKKNFKILK
ncbi:hypothetical protein CLPU_15c00290 [Gottschalkia purinilytica]|uniref:Uncharacterized protein n=2 Tax=Gottschalkia purinilytica TaxID=1503 RepID=A0A0L0W8E1_GOTPU|nr:hypothetical protein CLPU_15c00290 [Gottschalkia purinilytica]